MSATVLTAPNVHVHEIPHLKSCGPAPVSVEVRSSLKFGQPPFLSCAPDRLVCFSAVFKRAIM